MQIRELILNNFGKFTDKKIELGEGIHLIYGENEAGKSTIHAFIKGMLFGIERGRGRAALNDTFRKYEPWEHPNSYSGIMRFESGGKMFCLRRQFDKYTKGATLFCEDDGEELSLEHGDLEMLLGGLKESNYENTVSVAQLNTVVGVGLEQEIKNYAANYTMSGDREIDLGEALAYLKERKKELEKEIRDQEQNRQQKKEQIESEASFIWREIYRMEQEIAEEERNYQEQEELLKRMQIKKNGMERWRIHPVAGAAMLLMLVLIVAFFDRPWNFYVGIVVALGEIKFTWDSMKSRKKREDEEEELNAEGAVLKEKANRAQWNLEKLRVGRKEKQIQYHNLVEQMNELTEVPRETMEQRRKKEALVLAERTMLELSADMQKSIGQRLNEEVSRIFSEITEGKYEKVWIEEGMRISVMGRERKIGMNHLSRGTLEQLHLALRLAVAKGLYEEEYPVILDDTFAYYDEERLLQTLRWLADYEKQVLIFTCQKREEELLERAGISFRKIEL